MPRRILAAVAALLLAGLPATGAQATTYEVYAIRFGVLPAFPVSGLVAGADASRRLDIPVMVWLLKGSNGRRVLVDSGFYRQKFVERWKVRDFRSPAEAVAAAGVKPEDVTDVMITHAHWDHVDGADLFPKATVWIQREEYRYLYENFDRKVPIAQTLDAAANLKAQERIRSLISTAGVLVPGHDPAVFERFTSAGHGIVRIR